MMDSVTYEYLKRLREPSYGFSRNRYFELLSTPQGMKAMRLHKFLLSLENDITKYSQEGRILFEKVKITPAEESSDVVRMEISYDNIKSKRVSFLSMEEFKILLSNPAIGPTLSKIWKRSLA